MFTFLFMLIVINLTIKLDIVILIKFVIYLTIKYYIVILVFIVKIFTKLKIVKFLTINFLKNFSKKY